MSIINCLIFALLLPLYVYAEEATPVDATTDQAMTEPTNQGQLIDSSDAPTDQPADPSVAEENTDDIPEVKLYPEIRREPLPILPPYEIPLSEIQPFLNRLRVMDKQDLNEAPKVLGFPRQFIYAATDEYLYAGGLEDENPNVRQYEIFRIGRIYTDPDTNEILGYEANFMADAELVRPGEVAKLLVTAAKEPVRIDDRLFPVKQADTLENFIPTPVPFPIDGKIISVFDGVYEVGRLNVVAINLGQEQGLKPGHVLDIFQPGFQPCQPPIPLTEHMFPPQECDHNRTMTSHPAPTLDKDPEVLYDLSWPPGLYDVNNKKKFPLEKLGYLMVFSVFERVSYALVMKATDVIHVTDVVRSPGAKDLD